MVIKLSQKCSPRINNRQAVGVTQKSLVNVDMSNSKVS